MATPTYQGSFTGGMLSPNMLGRIDLDKFQTGALKLRNFFVDYRGGVSNRPGTLYIHHSTGDKGRLMPFIFSTDDSYVLWFSDLSVAIYQNLELVQTLTSPYAGDHLLALKFVQSADVLTITHPAYYPRNLVRDEDGVFSFVEPIVGPPFEAPKDLAGASTVSGAWRYGYVITALTEDNEETLPWIPITVTSEILDPNLPTPVVVDLEWGAVAGAYKYNVYKWGPIPEGSPVPTQFGFIGQTESTKFTDNNIAQDYAQSPPQFYDPFRAGQIIKIDVDDGDVGAYSYGTYPALAFTGSGTAAAAYGVVGPDGALTNVVILANGIDWDNTTSATCPPGAATFTITVDPNNYYPATVSYFQQRRVYGGSYVAPQTLEFTQVGLYENFDRSAAVLDDDGITIAIASREVNQIKSLVPMQTGLVSFTSGMAFLVAAADNGPLTPNNPAANPQASTGASDLQPIVVNYNILFVQAQGSIVRDMTFSFGNQSYFGDDRSIWANNLFEGFTLTDWAWSEEPHKLLWCIRDDGTALTMTYVPEQNIYGWAYHDTNGLFLSVVSVPENNLDAIYFLVRRFNRETETWQMYFERLDARLFDCPADTWFLDCAKSLTYTTGTSVLTLSGSQEGPVTFTAEGGDLDPIMEPKEDLTAVMYGELAVGSLTPPQVYLGNQRAGEYYDAARRQFVNPIYMFGGSATNDTGFTLYMGDVAENIAPAGSYDDTEARNLQTCVKNIDSGLVTIYDAYDAANTVPAGIGGGDGSWRRYAATQYLQCCPNTIDPWTGNIWLHAESLGDFACTLYCLRAEDAYSQIISPMLEIVGFTHYEPIFSTEDWIGVLAVNGGTSNAAFALTPREFTAEEFSQDFILAYANFEMPFNTDGNTAWRYVAVPGDSVYVFSKANTGPSDFKLYRFDFPTSAPWGGPIVGGGFTDVSPWSGANGPNTNCAAYIYEHNDVENNTLLLYYLPASNVLVCVSKLWPENTDNTLPYTLDPLLVRFDCTYVDLDDMSFDYHEGFVTGYMTADWAPTTDPNAAAWSVIECQEFNLYLGNTTYQFAGFDYTKRWLWFRVQPVVAGVWTPDGPIRQFGSDGASTRIVMVEYLFAKGSAPEVLQVITDTPWNTKYADYGIEVGNPNVIPYSLDDRYWFFGTISLYNSGIYDPTTNAFWWGTDQMGICYLGPQKFLDQIDYGSTNGPWLRITGGVTLDTGTIIQIGCTDLEVTGTTEAGYTGELFSNLESKYIVPNDPFNTPKPIEPGEWGYVTPATEIDMSHLVGFTVGLVLDGVVQAQQTVPPDGIIEWTEPASRVVCGLPYQSQFESLYLDAGFSPTIQGRRKNIPAFTARLNKTLGPVFGTSFTTMYGYKEHPLVVGTFSPLYSEDARVNVQSLWNKGGQVYVTQNHPMPVTLLALVPEVVIGDDGK